MGRVTKREMVEKRFGKPLRDILLESWLLYPGQEALAKFLGVTGGTISDWLLACNLGRKVTLIEAEPEARRQSRLREIEADYGLPIRDVLLKLQAQGHTTLEALAGHLGVKPPTIAHYLDRAGLSPIRRRQREMSRIESDYGKPLNTLLPELYDQLGSQTEVARELGVDQTTVSGWLVVLGLAEQVILVDLKDRTEVGSRKLRVK